MEVVIDQHVQHADTSQAPVQQPVLLPSAQQLQQLVNAIHNQFQTRSHTITATEQQQQLQGPTASITAPQLHRPQQQQQMQPTTLEQTTITPQENSTLQQNVPAIAPQKGPISTADWQHQPTAWINNGKTHQQPQVQLSRHTQATQSSLTTTKH
jgi:hypothetical protein